MESVIQIDDTRAFAFGLTWQALDPMMSRGSQLDEIRNGNGGRWIASYKVKGQENIGYAKDLVLPVRIETLSAAGQVAISEMCRGKTVFVLLEEQGHDGTGNDVAVIALLDGNVVHDSWVKVGAVDDIRQKFQEQCARAGAEFLTFGQTLTLPVDQPLEWADLLPKQRGTGLSKFKKITTVPVLPLKADIPAWILTLVLSLGVIGVGYWFWSGSVVETNRLRQLSMQKQAPDPAHLYAASAAQLLAQPVLPAGQALRELHAQLKGFPVQLVGWNLKQLNCTAAGCNALWSRKWGTYKEFVDRAPKEWGQVQLNNDGKIIAHRIPAKLTTASLPAIDKWPTEREFVLDVVTKWQKYSDVKFNAKLLPVALMAVPPSVQPQAAAALPNAIWAMAWSVKDTQWWMSEALFNLPSNVTVESVGLVFGPKINFNVEGKVYVRK